MRGAVDGNWGWNWRMPRWSFGKWSSRAGREVQIGSGGGADLVRAIFFGARRIRVRAAGWLTQRSQREEHRGHGEEQGEEQRLNAESGKVRDAEGAEKRKSGRNHRESVAPTALVLVRLGHPSQHYIGPVGGVSAGSFPPGVE